MRPSLGMPAIVPDLRSTRLLRPKAPPSSPSSRGKPTRSPCIASVRAPSPYCLKRCSAIRSMSTRLTRGHRCFTGTRCVRGIISLTCVADLTLPLHHSAQAALLGPWSRQKWVPFLEWESARLDLLGARMPKSQAGLIKPVSLSARLEMLETNHRVILETRCKGQFSVLLSDLGLL